MNRRKFLSFGGMTILLSSFSLTGCPTEATVFDKIFQYATLGLQAFQTVLDILSGANIIPMPLSGTILLVVSLVKSGFADLQVLVKEYEAAPADQKNTIPQKISLVLAEIEGHLSEFWSGLNIPDQNMAVLVKSLVALIISTISGFRLQLPGGAQARVSVSPKLPVKAKTLSPSEFKSEFNKLLEQHGDPHRIK